MHALSADEAVAGKFNGKSKKSKSSSRSVSRAKARHAIAHKPTSLAIPRDHSVADRSLDSHANPAPERVYDGLLPGEGYSVAYPSFANPQGRTECVELIKGLLGAPRTSLWKEGRKLKPHADEIAPGTAIATFVNGRYSNTKRPGNKHAAIFLRATDSGIWVLDQFVNQTAVKERFIPWHHPNDRRAANNASNYSTVRW